MDVKTNTGGTEAMEWEKLESERLRTNEPVVIIRIDKKRTAVHFNPAAATAVFDAVDWSETDKLGDVRRVRFDLYLSPERIGFKFNWENGAFSRKIDPQNKGLSINRKRVGELYKAGDRFSFGVAPDNDEMDFIMEIIT